MALKTVVVIVLIFFYLSCKKKNSEDKIINTIEIIWPKDSTLIGTWVRMSQQGPLKIHFKEDGTIETDLGNDNAIDIISNYTLKSDTIQFIDKEGKSCLSSGTYKVHNRGYSIAFDVLDDLCNGRIKTTSGYWVRPNHADLINQLNSIIKKTKDEKYNLHRGRMYLALGQSKLAKRDFDTYLKKDSTDAKVFINRAATRFPDGLKGVIYDCNKAIALDSTDKNAFFLRGLANYGLNNKQKGCNDFRKSIELGFKILEESEYYRCRDFWLP